jgi:hypothetical protein
MRLKPFPLLLLPLAFALLACTTITRLFELPDPEGLATDAFITATRKPTATFKPIATATPRPPNAPTLTPAPTLALKDTDQSAALRPDFANDVQQFKTATRYSIDVTIESYSTESVTFSGRSAILFTNPLNETLNDLVLMLWPNEGTQYFGSMQLTDLTIDGEAANYAAADNNLYVRIPLAHPLAPGQTVRIDTQFTAEAFEGIESNAARFGLTHGVLLAPTFYPLIPRFVNGQWDTLRPPSGGDTTSSDVALYDWHITAPADLALVATGSVIEQSQQGDQQTQHLVTGPVRDVTFTIGPLDKHSREVAGITVNVYTLPADAEYATDMLNYAEKQITTLQADAGPYPYRELDIIDAPGAFGGIEYPGLIYIGVVDGSDFFEVATVHEIGHQWFYGLVGDDQLREPWLDEGLATYTEFLYYEQVDPGYARGMQAYFEAAVQNADDPNAPIGLPIDGYSDGDYGTIVYMKGALFMKALRQELGDATFFQFLRAYSAEYRYKVSTSQDFQTVAEQTCACDLDALFDLWVYKGGK